MKTNIDWDNYLFRASQCYHISVGTIGITNEQEERIKELESRKTYIPGLTDKQKEKKQDLESRETLSETQQKQLEDLKIKENAVLGLTDNMQKELDGLIYKRDNPELPKTMQSELRKLYRAEKYDRNFLFTNKYVQKGIQQEEESFTTYQNWLKQEKGIKTLLLNNKERLTNDYFTGETDSNKHFYNKYGYGFDIKTSWNLATFPLEIDSLEDRYHTQNDVYMDLTGVDQWKTVYVLVNSSESTLHNEKMKHFYANDMHHSDRNEEKYLEICKDLEKMHIVDFDRFVQLYPGHELVFTKDEWDGLDLDIPLKDRVIEKTVNKDISRIEFLRERVNISREFLKKL